jgi:uncharacterized membrane protein YfcA
MMVLPALAVLAAFANIVEAVVGFGSTVLIVSIGSQFLSLEQLVPALLPLSLLLSSAIVVRNAEHVDSRLLLRRILPLTGLGMPIGFIAFQEAPRDALLTVFGLFVVGFASLEAVRLWRRAGGGPRIPLGPVSSALWLVTGGVIQGAFASGGPMIVYFAQRNLPDKMRFRATLAALWLSLNSVLIVGHVRAGSFNGEVARVALWLLPGVIAGILFGEKIHRRLPELGFRILVVVMLLVAGLAVLGNAAPRVLATGGGI